MITDHLDFLKRYAVPKAESILNFIASNDCAHLPDGEIEILGRELFVRVMSYTPKPAVENRFEIHRIHADLQYVAQGAEIMQTARLKDLEPLADYDPKGDFHFFKPCGAESDVIVQAGEFAVFYPNQPHRTSCLWKAYEGRVKKLVFKIKIN